MKFENNEGGTGLEAGVYDAVCHSIVDLGTQDEEYEGTQKVRKMCIIGWELLDELYDKDDETHRLRFSQIYTNSLGKRSNLRKHLAGWRGRDFTAEELEDFDSDNILGKPCKLVLTLNRNNNLKVESILPYKGTEEVEAEHVQNFDFADFEGEFPEWMSEGLVKWCSESYEYQDFLDTKTTEDNYDAAEPKEVPASSEDIPF